MRLPYRSQANRLKKRNKKPNKKANKKHGPLGVSFPQVYRAIFIISQFVKKTQMIRPEDDHGLMYLDGSYRTRTQIVDKALRENQSVIFKEPPSPEHKNFAWWTENMLTQQDRYQEVLGIPNHVSIEIPTIEPVTLVFFGDVHAGSAEVDYRRFAREIAYVRDRPNTYAITVGDLTDGYFWGGATQDEDVVGMAQQNLYMREALKELKGKLLCAWAGDHDTWGNKTGVTFYHRFREEFNAHYMEGVGYITLKVGDATYRITAAHRHSGFSVYNHAHASIRLWLDDAEGADICVTAHTHRKAIDIQTAKEFGGTAREIYFLALGTYKKSDTYSRKRGFSAAAEQQMGATTIVLDPRERKIEPHWKVGV